MYFLLPLVPRLAPEGENRDREAEILVLHHQSEGLSRRSAARSCAVSIEYFSRSSPSCAAGALDPFELQNVASDPSMATTKAQLLAATADQCSRPPPGYHF